MPQMKVIPEHLQIDSERISRELETFIKTSVSDYNNEGAIVGLSGGLDSSVVLALSVAAVGSNKVLGLIMPERDSSQDSETDARLLAETMGVRVEKVELTPILDEMGIYWATILGGEPFIRQDMKEIYKKHHDNTYSKQTRLA